jgi:hypothetical protein
MVRKDVVIFQNIWEVTNSKQGQCSLQTSKRYFTRREDKKMGWVNVRWGAPSDTYATHILPQAALLTLDKTIKVRCASLFLV